MTDEITTIARLALRYHRAAEAAFVAESRATSAGLTWRHDAFNAAMVDMYERRIDAWQALGDLRCALRAASPETLAALGTM